MQWNFIGILLVILLLITACKDPAPGTQSPAVPPAPPAETAQETGCRRCHSGMELDANHDFACEQCHQGNPNGDDTTAAHAGLIALPAHPDHMSRTCGKCHAEQATTCARSTHFTLHNAVNQTRQHFGAAEELPSLTAIPQKIPDDGQETALNITDDMLRRRCLRCHVYQSGDAYPLVRRGTGCAACHLEFHDGKLRSHRIQGKPEDARCLSCHYGNFVGGDYYGRYEHDYNWEYRTPYASSAEFARPFGVEQHDLTPDIHQERGLWCIDCHSGAALMGKNRPPFQCTTCHGWRTGQPLPPLPNLRIAGEQLMLTSAAKGQEHPVPVLRHAAHEENPGIACQVCHAQWSFNDSTIHLLRSATPDATAWERLTVQSSSWVENYLDQQLAGTDPSPASAMPDGINGETRPSVWLQAFTQRRWEDMVIRKDKDGIIKVFRPILDLRLSVLTEEGQVLFDNLQGLSDGMLPYTPHTTGKAGLLYRSRFSHLLDSAQQPSATPAKPPQHAPAPSTDIMPE